MHSLLFFRKAPAKLQQHLKAIYRKIIGRSACRTRLATLLRRIVMCSNMLGVVGPYSKMVKCFMQHL